jgi:hypothetical protein
MQTKKQTPSIRTKPRPGAPIIRVEASEDRIWKAKGGVTTGGRRATRLVALGCICCDRGKGYIQVKWLIILPMGTRVVIKKGARISMEIIWGVVQVGQGGINAAGSTSRGIRAPMAQLLLVMVIVHSSIMQEGEVAFKGRHLL